MFHILFCQQVFVTYNEEDDMDKKRVVITGLGVVAPSGEGTPAFWNSLSKGISHIDTIKLFDATQFPTKIAAEILDIDFTKILPERYLRAVHRVVPITLLATKEALADANLSKEMISSADVVVGTAAHGLGYFESQAENLVTNGYKLVSPHSCTGTFVGMLSSEISMHFGTHGQSLVLFTGCTSAHDAMGYAFNQIRFGQSKLMVTGGGESCVSPLVLAGFNRMMALSTRNDEPKRASRPFTKDRDGFVIGEGAWIFIFEELQHALDRNATIYAEVLGYSATSDAYHKTSPDPEATYLTKAMELALQDASVTTNQIDYINPHGTSTPKNDKIETLAIKKCFGDLAYQIPISSFKSEMGHPQGASGACGLAGTILAMKHSYIPPTINQDSPDPDCDLDYVPNEGRSKKVDYALLNSVAFGSRQSCLVVCKLFRVNRN